VPALALRDVQAGFWRSLHGGEPASELTAVVLPSRTLAPAERVAIYQGMYFWRLHEVLREDYPKTREALGEEFEALVRRYLTAHPSEHPSVRHLGRHLPAFLDADPAASDRRWLPDLAQLELARVDAFDAPDDTPIRPADLCAVSPEAWGDLTFAVARSVQVLRAGHPVHDVWACPTLTDVPARPSELRIWRHDFAVFHAPMDATEASAFSTLIAGERFAAMCETVAEHVSVDAAAGEAGALLARWVEDGLIVRLAS
jgi:hypothetical protein